MAPTSHRSRIASYQGDEPFVFVSYSHEDSALVFPEIEALADAGLRIYYDEGIHPGHRWHDDLAKALGHCAVFVFFATPRSVLSRVCQDEISFVIDHDKPTITVYLEDAELSPGMRLAIGNRQAIMCSTFEETTWRDRLIRAICEHIGDETSGQAPAIQPSRPRTRRYFRLSAALALMIIALAGASFVWWRHLETLQEEQAARITRIRQLVEKDQYGKAFSLAQPLMRTSARSDDTLKALWKQIVLPGRPLTAEPDATLSYMAYDGADNDWIVAGSTPVTRMLDLPKGVVRIRLEKPGFRTGEFVVANPGPSIRSVPSLENDFLKTGFSTPDVPLPLARNGQLPEDMVLVPATDEPMFLMGLPDTTRGFDRRSVAAFGIARFEVTNREYKAFVDAGGYDNATYWQGLTFHNQGHKLSWAEARARFIDKTGRPGAALWELSTYPSAQADMPVRGVSWYEAVAYARFRHRTLPTIHHWTSAAFGPFEGQFETAPTVAGRSRVFAHGPIDAHRKVGLGPWGTYNMAGNVREWVWNSVGDDPAVLGGAWGDSRGEFQTLMTAPPMDRSPEFGIRLMKSFAPVPDELLAPLASPVDQAYARRAPLSDEAFTAIQSEFTVGNRTPRGVHVEQFASSDVWSAEEVRLTYGKDDALTVYVVLPRHHRSSLQPVLYGTPWGPYEPRRPNRDILEQLRTADVDVLGGRALVIPIWAGQYQRAVAASTDPGILADQFHQLLLSWYQDGVRTIDYLATRDDMDMQRVGFVGLSAGGIFIAPPLLVMDGRIRAAALLSAGVWIWPPQLPPAMDVVNFAPRIHLPVLMIDGRFDSVLPQQLSQRRLFDLLGTPEEDKRLVLFDVSHFSFPHSQLAKEVNDWFDKYLGPVK